MWPSKIIYEVESVGMRMKYLKLNMYLICGLLISLSGCASKSAEVVTQADSFNDSLVASTKPQTIFKDL